MFYLGLYNFPFLDPFHNKDPMVEGNLEVFLNLSAFCVMAQENKFGFASALSDDDEEEIWEKECERGDFD